MYYSNLSDFEINNSIDSLIIVFVNNAFAIPSVDYTLNINSIVWDEDFAFKNLRRNEKITLYNVKKNSYMVKDSKDVVSFYKE
jgi:hypothetical protein